MQIKNVVIIGYEVLKIITRRQSIFILKS